MTTHSTDPEGHHLAYLVDWGDMTGLQWTAYYPSGESTAVRHVFARPDTYGVRARARDFEGAESDWSSPVLLAVEEPPPGPPENLQAVAATDSTVLLTWTSPQGGQPDAFEVHYRQVGDSRFAVVGEPTATSFEHDPLGGTGTYRVGARFGSDLYLAAATPTTTPVHTQPLVVCELNGTGDQGFGWNRSSGQGGTFSMTDASNADSVDYYITNFSAGCLPPCAVASPDLGPDDPGGNVPPAPWRVNGVGDPVQSEQDPLPAYVQGMNYFSYTDITRTPLLLPAWTPDGYYGLIKVLAVDSTSGEVTVESWFQLVSGLRLIQH